MIWKIKRSLGLALSVCGLAISLALPSYSASGEGTAVQGVACQDIMFEDASFTICNIDPKQVELRSFLNNADGAPFGQFSRVNAGLRAEGAQLVIAMNGGMYHPDRSAVGLYIEDGETVRSLVRGASPGNFGLVPNGVFCIREGRADVIETERFAEQNPGCRFATQSGPMLVIDGNLHPRFIEDSTSRYIRNGVGTSADGEHVVWAISNQPVNFHQFGRLFRDHLALPQALFLDGKVSRLYAPALNRSDFGWPMGPILGVVAPLDAEDG